LALFGGRDNETKRDRLSYRIVTVNGLYSLSTLLGTFICGLIFVNYDLGADQQPGAEPAPDTSSDTKSEKRGSAPAREN
jgi:hypothetical protein